MKLDDVKYAQRQRLLFLDRCLTWRGAANRRDLMDRFDISNAQAAIDFRTYLQIACKPPHYDAAQKTYIASSFHQPLELSKITSDFEVLADRNESLPSSIVPQPHRRADPTIIMKLYHAIKGKKAIHVRYTSFETGADEGQWLAPVRFTSDGENAHLRAFSFKHQAYRDYLPIRIDPDSAFEERPLEEPLPTDVEWQTRARIRLRPKQGLSSAQAAVVMREYGFESDNLTVTTRKALEFYFIQRWRLGEESSRLEIANIDYDEWSDAPE